MLDVISREGAGESSFEHERDLHLECEAKS